MHILTVTPTQASCSCGWKKETITGAESSRLGYIHASQNRPSVIDNKRRDGNDAA